MGRLVFLIQPGFSCVIPNDARDPASPPWKTPRLSVIYSSWVKCFASLSMTRGESSSGTSQGYAGRKRCYDFSVTSQRESLSSSSRVRLTLNSAPASRRSALPAARSNSNRTGRRPGELARILRTSRSSSPVVAGENCKSTADC